MTREELISYCQNEYNAEAYHPFKRFPAHVALRHPNGKWFGLIMNVPAAKLGLPGTTGVEIVNLKVDSELNALLQGQAGFLPAYHMAKEHWLSARLDQFKRVADLADLIAGSYEATR